jgi:hypothetical protein
MAAAVSSQLLSMPSMMNVLPMDALPAVLLAV